MLLPGVGRQRAFRVAIALLPIFALLRCAVPARADWVAAGTFLYADKVWTQSGFTGEYNNLPIRFAHVEVRDASTEEVLASGGTDARGRFSIAVPDTAVRNVYARVFTRTADGAPYTLDVRDGSALNSLYSYSSDIFPSHPPNLSVTVPTPMVATDGRAGGPFNILDCLEGGIDHVAEMNEGRRPQKGLSAIWLYGRSGARSTWRTLTLSSDEAYDDMLIYGLEGVALYAVYQPAPIGALEKAASPQEAVGSEASPVLTSREAFARGWGKFFAASLRDSKGAGTPQLFIGLTSGSAALDTPIIEDLEEPARTLHGAADDLAVASFLWDAYDGPQTRDFSPGQDDDPVTVPQAALLDVASQTIKASDGLGDFGTIWSVRGWAQAKDIQALIGALVPSQTPDSFEPDNDPAHATRVGINDPPAWHTLFPAGDVDWVRFDVEADHTYMIVSDSSSDGAMLEVDLYWNPSGQNAQPFAIFKDASYYDSALHGLWGTFNAASAGTMYARCSPAISAYRGTYNFQVASAPPIPRVTVFGDLSPTGAYLDLVTSSPDWNGGFYILENVDFDVDSTRINHVFSDGSQELESGLPGSPARVLTLTCGHDGSLYWISPGPADRYNGTLWRKDPSGSARALQDLSQLLYSDPAGGRSFTLYPALDGSVLGLIAAQDGRSVLYRVLPDGSVQTLREWSASEGRAVIFTDSPRDSSAIVNYYDAPLRRYRLARYDSAGKESLLADSVPNFAATAVAANGDVVALTGSQAIRYASGSRADTLGSYSSSIGSEVVAFFQASDGNCYGAMEYGPLVFDDGTIFRMTPEGEFTKIADIAEAQVSESGFSIERPLNLYQTKDGHFVGISMNGGTNNQGTIFRMAIPEDSLLFIVSPPTLDWTPNSVSLHWVALQTDQYETQVLRSLSASGPFTQVADMTCTGNARSTWVDRDVRPGADYYYQVESRLSPATSWHVSTVLHAHTSQDHPRIDWPVPNPTPGSTKIHFVLSEKAVASLEVFTVTGARIRSLPPASMDAGPHDFTWDGRDRDGRRAGSGVYLIRLRAGAASVVRKVLMIH